jgi:hypothetical protein
MLERQMLGTDCGMRTETLKIEKNVVVDDAKPQR